MSGSFTNRHGRKTSIDGAVEEIAVIETRSSHQASVIKKKRSLSRLPIPKISMRTGLIVVGTFGLVILGYFVLADTARRDFDRVASTMTSKVTEVKAQSISEGASAKDALSGLNQKLVINEPCQSSMPNVVYRAYAPAVQSLDACNEVADRYSALRQSLGQMQSYVSYLEEQSKILDAPLAVPTDGNYAEIPEFVSRWESAVKDLRAINDVPLSLKPAHEELVVATVALSAGWSELQNATNAQDVERFMASERSLASAYETLRSSGDAFSAIIKDQQAAISAAASRF